jgi:hypothetical protein
VPESLAWNWGATTLDPELPAARVDPSKRDQEVNSTGVGSPFVCQRVGLKGSYLRKMKFLSQD